jgi:predicted metal-dependent RNase
MADKVKQIFVVMGEPKSSLFLVQKIRDNFALNATAPSVNDVVELEM